MDERARASSGVYDSARLADGYAFSRPPLHPPIVRRIAERLQITTPLQRVLDVGCGAGRSTIALDSLAEIVVGLEPFLTMLAHCRVVAPRASFAVGMTERLPFPNRVFDLITAAGALNYADLHLGLPELARVLAATGTLVVYDFSAGRRFRARDALEKWFAEFTARYPFRSSGAFDVQAIAYAPFGLRLDAYEEFEIALPFNAESYWRYILSETNIERAIARGAPEREIRDWCRRTIETIFGDATREVLFHGYIAYVKPEKH
jgi:SAM-dependent methyltransferase